MRTNTRRRRFVVVWTAYFTLCMLAFIWPMGALANRLEPRIAGVPFFVAWNLIWIGMIFVGGLVMYVWDGRLTGEGADDE